MRNCSECGAALPPEMVGRFHNETWADQRASGTKTLCRACGYATVSFDAPIEVPMPRWMIEEMGRAEDPS